MDLEKELKKLGYAKWDNKKKSQMKAQEYIHRWYKKNGKWKLGYYIKIKK